RTGLPKGVDGVVLRALEKDAGKRYGSAAQMAKDLRKAFSGGSSRLWLLLLIVAVILLVLLVVSYFLPGYNDFLMPVRLITHMQTPLGATPQAASSTGTEVIHILTPAHTFSAAPVETEMQVALATATGQAAAQATQIAAEKAKEAAAAQATQTAIAQQTSIASAKATSTASAMRTATASAASTVVAEATRTAMARALDTATAVQATTASAQAAVIWPAGTQTPSPYKYPTPQLQSPAKDATFTGYVTMEFSWQPVAPQLAADEYYALVITFLHRDGHRYPYLQATTKDTRWHGQLNPFLYDSEVLADRGLGWQHGWYVVVMRDPGTDSRGQITGTELSPHSEERLFTWKLEGETRGEPGVEPTDVRPTPTRTPKI
ncbi:MAG: hypothetical protein ACPLRM_00990, partial [Anaerolineae bacterium]